MVKKIFLIHHSHTDIGFTDIQTKVIQDQAKFLEMVLDYCRKTDSFPEEAKFRWTCETAWTVKNILERKPDKFGEFIARVKEGRIEVTALYHNLTDLFTLEMLIRSLYFAKSLEERFGIRVITGMNCDINGLSWNLPQILKKIGVDYLMMATDEIRSFAPKVPRPFFWESPDGSRVLVWNACRKSWYWEGGLLGFTEDFKKVQRSLPEFLAEVEKEYSYEELALQIALDNQPPSLKVSEIVREWNRKGLEPELIVSTPSRFFQIMERKYRTFPVYPLAWPDWWADGNGSCAYETSLCLKNSRQMLANEASLALTNLAGEKYPKEKLAEAWENMLFFAEHTFGADDSVRKPFSLQTKSQWAIKSNFIYQAAIQVNSLSNEVKGNRIQQDVKSGEPVFTKPAKNLKMESKFYRLLIDKKTGTVKSIYDKELKTELVDRKSPYRFNQYLYETIISPEGREAIWKENDTKPIWSPDRKVRGAKFRRSGAILISVAIQKDGFNQVMSLKLKGRGCRTISQHIRLYQEEKRIDFVNTLDKEEVLHPEAVYYLFPFKFRRPKIKICGPGNATFEPEKEQLPGTCRDYYSVEDWVLLTDKAKSVLWLSPDVPLVQLGGINTAQWSEKIEVNNGLAVSFVMNNYWYTNFRGLQSGETTFTYTITSVPGKMELSEAASFAQKITNPRLATTLTKLFRVNKNNVHICSFKKSEDNKGFILRVKESAGRKTPFRLFLPSFPKLNFFLATPNEKIIKRLGRKKVTCMIGPYEIHTYYITPNPRAKSSSPF